MHNLSLIQALSVWTDLCDAYHGKNKFGGHVAEIYVYRFMSRNPTFEQWHHDQEKFKNGFVHDEAMEALDHANSSMYELLKHFEETKDAIIEVEERTLGVWLKRARYHHRVHVEVLPR